MGPSTIGIDIPDWLNITLGFVLAVVLSEISWRVVEKPFLNLRGKPKKAADPAPLRVAPVAVRGHLE